MLVRGVTFPLANELPCEVQFLLDDFRLAVNEAIRVGFAGRVTSRNGIARLAYKALREEHSRMYSQHLVSSFEIAAAILKNYRRRLRKDGNAEIPFMRRRMMKAENTAYKLDRATGVIDLPIRAGYHVKLSLIVSQYHRKYLENPALSLGSLTVFPDRVIVAFRKESPKSLAPASVIVLDTNERSLDGVFIKGDETRDCPVMVRASFSDISTIQQCHHDRRRKLQKKKAHDRRMSTILCHKEGRREHDRVAYRIHQVANAVISFAEEHSAVIVLEELAGTRPWKKKELNRRISLWPRRKLHHNIEYKAQWRGIPVVKVDPRYSSRKCPICGRIQDSRMGTEFKCECGWHLDRHINASLNLLQTAISKGLKMAGGLRFDPGAFQHDVMMILYEPAMAARSEPNGTSQNSMMT